MGASLGAYHAANTLFKHPDVVKRCFALSGVYDMKRFMDGAYDDNFYFNNPVDYLANIDRPVDARPAGELRHPHRDRHRAVRAQRRGVPAVGDPREPRHPASSRRLGSARRARLAVLEASDARVPSGNADCKMQIAKCSLACHKTPIGTRSVQCLRADY